MIITTHQDRGIDFHLKAMGFADREHLQIISHDDRTYFHAGIYAKPDWTVLDTSCATLYVLDYKTRIAHPNQITEYEAYQIGIFGYVTASELARTWNKPLSYIMGVMYANDQRIQVSIDKHDIREFRDGVPAAIAAYRARGVSMQDHRIGASQLARYLADPTLSRPVHKQAANAGTQAHASIKRYAPPSIFEHTHH